MTKYEPEDPVVEEIHQSLREEAARRDPFSPGDRDAIAEALAQYNDPGGYPRLTEETIEQIKTAALLGLVAGIPCSISAPALLGLLREVEDARDAAEDARYEDF